MMLAATRICRIRAPVLCITRADPQFKNTLGGEKEGQSREKKQEEAISRCRNQPALNPPKSPRACSTPRWRWNHDPNDGIP